MDKISRILECVNRTNPEMTMERLIEELKESRYSALSLSLICGNDGEAESLSA